MDAVQANPGEAGGINLSISIGSSSSQSNSTQTSNRAAGSTVAAGGNISMVASGAGQDSNLTIQGSTARAGNNIQLSADNKVNLLAAKNTTEQHGTNKNSSASIGVSFGTDGFLVTASASRGRGKADGNDVAWTNTHVDAGNQLSIRSGGDTTLQGAVASGKQVIADVGGNLKIESLQDTSQFASTQQSVGGSISVGVGKVGGSLNISKSNAKGDFASVTEQSGIKAGDGGFQINVKGNTDLKGAVITSTDRAAQDGRNSLNTATLTQSDIQNRDNHDASGFSIGISSSGGSSAGMGSDKGSQSSTTQSGISQAAVTITDNAKQQNLTGKTAAETVATLNRDASTDKNTSAALTRARDGNQLIADVQAQSQITAAFGANAAKQVGHYAGNKARELRSQGNDAEAKKWDEGGEYRVILHTAAGALGGGLQGAAGAAASATAMAEIGKAIDNMDVPAPVKQVLGAVAAAAIGTAAGGGAGAAAAFSTDLNNRQLHPSEEQWLKSRAKDFAKKEGISEQQAMERLTQQALKDVDYLWRSQSTDGNDAAAQEFLASSKQTFTNDLGEQQRLFTTNGQQLLRPEMFADTANPDFYKQFAQSGISRSLTDGLLKEFKDSGIDIKNSAADLAAKVRDNPGLVADAVWETVKNLPQSVVDNFKETGTAIGEGAAGLTPELTTKINAIYGTDTAAARKAILFIRTTTAIMGAGAAAKTATDLSQTTATAIGKKLDDILESRTSNISEALAGTAAKATTNGFVNATKVCTHGCAIKKLTPTEQELVSKITANGDKTGQLTEQLLTSVAQRTKGITVLPGGKYGSDNGFDLVLKDANGGVTIVMDAKQMNQDAFQLSSSGRNKDVQLSQAWIKTVLGKLPDDSPAKAAVDQAIKLNTLRTAIGGVDRSTETLKIVPVDVP
ncbi:hemagglutinin repeat-containing protein [Verminephrobacter aporrectodeae]|uniref:hemagglutinin repeat-containing protein n=1 Tax=Verminephrobacter aporrectodeae TaxID=1110389 RepID=UPI0022445C3F|nr:hemagglutinin repeat-containing protein [Verminephrobacter aporrectodeae]